MKLSTLFLCAVTLASQAQASIAAGKYQFAFLWYAYRMNVNAYNLGLADMLIAPGCSGSVVDGSCYLDEFLDHIWDWDQTYTSGDGRTGVTVTDNSMSVDDLAEKIEVAGRSGGYVDPYKLSPNTWTEGTAKPSFVEIFDQVTKDVQTIRTAGGEDTTVTRFVAPIADAMEQTTAARIQDNLSDLQEALGELMDEEGFTVVTGENGLIDPEKTYATNTGNSRDWRGALKKYVSANWPTERASIIKEHMHIVSNWQYFTSQIKSPLPC